LNKGYSIVIKVEAINAYGTSQVSLAGNGAVIVFVPDAPILLQNNPSVTSKTTIGFTWSQGLSNGGS